MSKASVVPHLVLVAAAVGALALDAATAMADGIPGVVMTDAQNVTDWSGVYIGGRLGGAWGDVNWSEDSPAFGTNVGASFSPSGLAGGVFGGANLQLGQWIFGLEASYSTAKSSDFIDGWTIGGGVEYAFWPSVILGVEYDHVDLSLGNTANCPLCPFNITTGSTAATVSGDAQFSTVMARLSFLLRPED